MDEDREFEISINDRLTHPDQEVDRIRSEGRIIRKKLRASGVTDREILLASAAVLYNDATRAANDPDEPAATVLALAASTSGVMAAIITRKEPK